ncbi:MAG: hypothetical protein M3680_06790 [Myxococcota bacterium]|nr:hypothetical protein [Myxococcota bacterium]
MHRVLVLVIAVACATEQDLDPPDNPTVDAGVTPDGATGDPDTPPVGHAALVPWLAAGHYLSWACEEAPHAPRPGGAHGANRVCSNAALAGSPAGTYPIGAASVKELYRNGAIDGYAVGIKRTTGTAAASWYWYEVLGGSVIVDGDGVPLCANCHADAPRDHVFTHVR